MKKFKGFKDLNLINILFFVLIPLIIVGALVIKTIYLCNALSHYDYQNLSEFLENTNVIDVGVAIIGIAVSVWLGINISNMVDEKRIKEMDKSIGGMNEKIESMGDALKQKDSELDHFSKKASEEQDRLKERIKDITNNNDEQNFINELQKTKYRYESSEYLYSFFCEDIKNKKKINFSVCYEVERLCNLCSDAYEKGKWQDAYKYAVTALEALDCLDKDTDGVDTYINIRKSDSLFYKNVATTHLDKVITISESELQESIKLYECVLPDVKEKRIAGFIYNTIGYTYDILAENIKNIDKDKKYKYLRYAIYNMETAVDNNKKGRYYRNLGLAYEHFGMFEEARAQYIKAVQVDAKDYKGYNNIISITLKIIDYKLGVNNRADEGKLLFNYADIDANLKKELLNVLNNAKKYEELAIHANYFFEDIQFNICKMYMYEYILNGCMSHNTIEKAIGYGKRAYHINNKSVGAKFCLRNAYESSHHISKAWKINEELVNLNVGDSIKMKKLYEKFLPAQDGDEYNIR